MLPQCISGCPRPAGRPALGAAGTQADEAAARPPRRLPRGFAGPGGVFQAHRFPTAGDGRYGECAPCGERGLRVFRSSEPLRLAGLGDDRCSHYRCSFGTKGGPRTGAHAVSREYGDFDRSPSPPDNTSPPVPHSERAGARLTRGGPAGRNSGPGDDLGRQARSARRIPPGAPLPEQPEALAVPAKKRAGLGEHEGLAPVREHHGERYQEPPDGTGAGCCHGASAVGPVLQASQRAARRSVPATAAPPTPRAGFARGLLPWRC